MRVLDENIKRDKSNGRGMANQGVFGVMIKLDIALNVDVNG